MAEEFSGPELSYRWVDTDGELESVIDTVSAARRYAIDTEFHRERTYFPQLALVQLGWEGQIVLIDPLSVDIGALDRLFRADTLALFHAAQQDLDVLTHAVGSVPVRFFDTQIAGSFVGYGTPSLVSLLSGELDIRPPKSDRLTDWLKRPLTKRQLDYAASDVAYLEELADRLGERLTALGRVEWVRESCRELAERPVSGAEPSQAWIRLKDARSLSGPARAVAQSVAAWREREAMRRNTPARQVLPDLAIVAVAQKRPTSIQQLKATRGVDERINRSGVAEAVLAAVKEGLAAEPPDRPPSGDQLARDLRPAVTLISAWISQVAKDESIDSSMLATRADLVEYLAGAETARLGHGWRHQLLGSGIERLVKGDAALTFAAADGLRLVDLESGSANAEPQP